MIDLDSIPFLSWPLSDYTKGLPRLKNKIREFSTDVVFIPTAAWVNFHDISIVVIIRKMELLALGFNKNPLCDKIKKPFHSTYGEARL